MASFIVRAVNSSFITDTAVTEVETAEAAQAIGVRGALAMATDEIVAGAASAVATVMVSDGDEMLSYVAVSLSVAPLCTG